MYHAPSPSQLRTIRLDAFVALYHRPSGTTHLLSEPAPEILEILSDGDASLNVLRCRLAERFNLLDDSVDALTARLNELVAAGLIEQR